MAPKFYEVLDVPQNASKDDIKRAYKKRAMATHPDKGGDPEVFKEINHAYSVLSDENERARYDQLGDDGYAAAAAGGGNPFGGMDPSSIFEQMFGGMPFGFGDFGGRGGGVHHASKCNDHLHAVRLTLADAYAGMSKTVRVSVQKQCTKCREQCHHCQGRGTITDMRRMGFMTQVMTRPCDKCNGSGTIVAPKKGCGECQGAGSITTDHKLELKFPPGVSDRHRVTFKGLGEQLTRAQDQAGDLVFEVQIQADPAFVREGNDLVYKHTVTLLESLIGKNIVIPHFGGDIRINTMDTFGIIKEGQVYVIPGKGMTAGGSLKLIFQVTYPPKDFKIDETARGLLVSVFT